MSDQASRTRPIYRNVTILQILTYRLPPAAKTSILHRISWALLFFALPIIIVPLFGKTITSPESFAIIAGWLSHPLWKLILLFLCFGYLHQFCAGFRFLLLDYY